MAKIVTQNMFIDKANKIHKYKYDYSNVKYVDSKTKVCIICPEHGEFWQTPNNHLNGKGCPNCCKNHIRYNTESFVKKSKEVHNDKYDYSKVVYINNRSKVCIICPEHGEFWQRPSDHLRGCGCLKCGRMNSTKKQSNTINDFITKANNIHNNKYDYSKTNYINSYTKVCIICPEHGEFWQTPIAHLNGQGCHKCSKTFHYTTEEWIKQARKIHADKYDYSKVEYINSESKVCIICPEHGEFWQRPSHHLNGVGCPICGFRLNTNKLTNEYFIQTANKIHNGKYDYSKTNYINCKTKVCIICPKHGEFWQIPSIHLQGHGCPICRESKLEKDVLSILTKNKINFERQKRFNWLGKQSLDFYLNDYNIAIECQGEQHFYSRKNGLFTEEKVNKIKERDNRKFNICLKHNVKIIYYSNYKDLTETYDEESLMNLLSAKLRAESC